MSGKKLSVQELLDAKKKILVKFFNRILANDNRGPIEELEQFDYIYVNDLVKEANVMVMEEMKNEIFEFFDKRSCGYYRRSITEDYIATLLKCMCKDVGMELTRESKFKSINKKPKKIVWYVLKKIEDDQTEEKKIVMLEFLNRLLLNSDMEPINEITEFNDVLRQDLIKDSSVKIMENSLPVIFGPFHKDKCNYYRKCITQNYIIVLLRYMCLDIGYKLCSKQHNAKIGDKDKRITTYYIATK